MACDRPVAHPVESVRQHLVIDAGSSGTRLCLFRIERRCPLAGQSDTNVPGKDCSCHAEEPQPEDNESQLCRPIPNAGGLAEMSGPAARRTLAGALNQLTKELQNKGTTTIDAASLGGTGGFRQIPEARATQLLAVLEEELVARWAASRARILSGADEGRLTWQAVRQSSDSDNHAILETGGASIQFAHGQAGRIDTALSLPLGMNRAFEAASQHPNFAACFPFGSRDGATDFESCLQILRESVLRGPAASELAAAGQSSGGTPGELYGAGSSWKAIFRGMDRDVVTVRALQAFGKQVCARRNLSETERTGKYVQRRCFLYAYQTVLLEATGYAHIRRTNESWPRGAAIAGELFPACAGES